MTERCSACHRPLLHPVETPEGPMGQKCAARLHPKVARAAKAKPAQHVDDERQAELFPGSVFSRMARYVAAWWNDVTEPGLHL